MCFRENDYFQVRRTHFTVFWIPDDLPDYFPVNGIRKCIHVCEKNMVKEKSENRKLNGFDNVPT